MHLHYLLALPMAICGFGVPSCGLEHIFGEFHESFVNLSLQAVAASISTAHLW
jgi:hypothetical protein